MRGARRRFTWKEREARIRREAFAEAAALRPEYPEGADGTYSDGWCEGCNEYGAVLTNLAKKNIS